ncbi:MAG: hypothetical protein QOJ40_1020 [Verrucomicrobiota bacterium]
MDPHFAPEITSLKTLTAMNYYTIGLLDYPKTSWVLHDMIKALPKRPRKEGVPPVFYKFFHFPDAKVQIKPQYQRLCCKSCGRFETDQAFAIGFADPVTIHFKEDMGLTADRVFVINDKCLKALKSAKVGGYETKPIGKSGWHAFRVTVLVDSIKGLLKTHGRKCPECGRPESAGAFIWSLGQISPRALANTFFSTKLSSAALPFRDRSIFMTEEVLKALKDGKVKGPCCDRLQTDEEIMIRKAKEKKGISWLPPGMTVYLRGK